MMVRQHPNSSDKISKYSYPIKPIPASNQQNCPSRRNPSSSSSSSSLLSLEKEDGANDARAHRPASKQPESNEHFRRRSGLHDPNLSQSEQIIDRRLSKNQLDEDDGLGSLDHQGFSEARDNKEVGSEE